MVTPLGAERFAFALVSGARKGATEVLDRWESAWPMMAVPDETDALIGPMPTGSPSSRCMQMRAGDSFV